MGAEEQAQATIDKLVAAQALKEKPKPKKAKKAKPVKVEEAVETVEVVEADNVKPEDES